MADTPNSFKDPYWATLASAAGDKVGLPTGLLPAIVSRGERSNNDQVSDAGAKTPFQIIPSTRKAALDKWGVDAYLSPENAAEVSARLLKDSLDRNGNDPKLAVAEYVGGTNRANWGPTTKAYVQRVTGAPLADAAAPPQGAAGAVPVSTSTSTPPGAMPDGSQSTFDKLNVDAAPTSAIQNIFKAYTSGQMSPEQKTAFEGDVNSGKLMLPRGASLTQAPAAPPSAAISNILAAYEGGKMNADQKAAFEADVQSGKLALPAGVTIGAPTQGDGSPLGAGTMSALPDIAASLGSQALLTPVAGLAGLATSAGNALGLTDATGADAVNEVMSHALQPHSPAGQSLAGVVNYPLEKLAQGADYVGGKVADVTGSPALGAAANTAINVGLPALLGKVGGAVAAPVGDAAAAALRNGVGKVASVVDTARTAVPEAIRNVMPGGAPADAAAAAPGTMGSVGAAGVDMATQRRAAAAELPVPIKLTEGQATRDFAQQQFERETAKNPDVGAPIRTRLDEQNAAMAQNIDHFIDQTGAEAPNLRATGVAVDDAVNKAADADKNRIRVAYKKAEAAGEMEAPVSLDALVSHLNEQAPAAGTAPILDTARNFALKLGIATVGEDGALIPKDVPLKTAEQFRQDINAAVDEKAPNIRQAAMMKNALDAGTQSAGGVLYAQARALRARFAQNYDNHSVIADILNDKRGTTDRKVALEDVHRRMILDGSLDDVRQVRRVLQRGGEEGQQAWRELQGQTLNHIKEQALGNSARDSRGNPIMSAAKLDKVIKSLDSDGKLDFIFGKKGAAQLRTVNDVAKDVYTSPPGSVNHSNTASVLAGLLDLGMTTFTGLPIPVASGARYLVAHMRDKKLAARVNEALNKDAVKAPKNMRPAPRPMNAPSSTVRN